MVFMYQNISPFSVGVSLWFADVTVVLRVNGEESDGNFEMNE